MSRKNVILHVGTYKTGTTAIQNFMCTHERKLRKMGWYIPVTGRAGSAHHHLIWSVMGREDSPPANELLEDLRTEIKACGKPNIFLSTELMFNCTEISLLLKTLEEFDIRVIVYLRRQDEFMSSYYAQLVKHPRFREKEPASLEATQLKGYMNYRKVLDFWEQHIDKSSITVRPFEKQQLTNGVIEDILNILKLNSKDFTKVSSTKSNVTLPMELIEFLRLANGLALSEHEHNELLAALEEITKLDTGVFTHQNFFSPQVRIETLKACEEDNNAIAARYIGESRQLFSAPWPKEDETWTQPTLSIESLARIMAGLWAKQERELAKNPALLKLRNLFQ